MLTWLAGVITVVNVDLAAVVGSVSMVEAKLSGCVLLACCCSAQDVGNSVV